MPRPSQDTSSRRPSSQGTSRRPGSAPAPKKKKSGGGFSLRKIGKDFLRGGQQAARGLPTGVKINAKALIALHQGDPRPIARMGKESAKATVTSVRHPLRDPFSTFLTALSLASAGGGSAARLGAGASALGKTGKIGKAVSAAAKKPVYTRSLRGLPSRPGSQPKTFSGLEASSNPLVRGARKITLDPAYSASRKRQAKHQRTEFDKTIKPIQQEGRKLTADIRKLENRRAALQAKGHSVRAKGSMNALSDIDDEIRDVKKTLRENNKLKRTAEKKINAKGPGGLVRRAERRTSEERQRFAKQTRSEEPGSIAPTGDTIVPELINAPMNLLRLGMVLRPRYFAQNLSASTLQLLLQQGPHGIVKSTRTARQARKYDKAQGTNVAGKSRATMGDPGQTAGLIETTGPLSAKAQKAAHAANWLEARLREIGYYGAARREGITKPADLDRLQRTPDSPQAHRVAKRGNEAMVDYSRLGKRERGFMRSGIPIFYPMFKGFTRYGVRYPFEHSVQAALLNQMGQKGYDAQQEDFPGGLPPWFPYLTKAGAGSTSNPQNIHPFSPAADILEALSVIAGNDVDPTRSALNYVGPAPELAYGLATGNQLSTGWPLKGKDDGMSNLEATARDFAPTLPGFDVASMLGAGNAPGLGWLKPRKTAVYGEPSFEEQFLMWLLGPGAPRQTDMRELRNQAKRSQGRGR